MKVDTDLVVKASAGDKDAFGKLYNFCYKDLYKFALYTLGAIMKKRTTFNIDDLIETPSDDSKNIEEDISESAALAGAMAKLEAEERMIVVLSALHGYTNR